MLWMILACINDEKRFHRVEVEGRILAGSTDAEIYLSAHHSWFGEGDLRIPAKLFDTMVLSSAEDFRWTVDVPVVDSAEGLLLYAWQDLDGDAVFCGLDGEEEASGIYEVDFPTFQASVDIVLDQSCAAPETLWEEIGEQ